jgi:hypothetical protein
MRYLISEQIKHIYQPTGHSCGPTCIKMVGDYLCGDIGKIDDICSMCGTDWVVGTPPDKMKVGLDKLGISYVEHQKEIEPFHSIKETVDRGNVAIVRTVTQGVPHWIVIDGYDDESFNINDPWLGPKRYTEEELDSIWRIRDFFYFEIRGKSGEQEIGPGGQVVIRPLVAEDIPIIRERLSEVFKRTGLSNNFIANLIQYSPSITVVAEVQGNLAGFYFLHKKNIPKGGKDFEILKDLKGVEGVALGVFPEYKNLGIGKQLISYSQGLSGQFDYIWGYQFKSLKNIDNWLKRRKIYSESPTMYITYELFRNPA